MSDYEARVLDDIGTWARNTVLLAVRERRGSVAAFLMRDGTWREVGNDLLVPDAGIEIPRAAVEAIAAAIAEWQGHTSHADTEARVLREWLTVERNRVDGLLTDVRSRP